MTFPFFNSFPPEIHSLILSHAASNDRACLTLTWYLPPFQIFSSLLRRVVANTSTSSIHPTSSSPSATKTISHLSAQSPNWHHGQTDPGSATTNIVKNATMRASKKQRSVMRNLDYLFQGRESAGQTGGLRIVNAFLEDRNCIKG